MAKRKKRSFTTPKVQMQQGSHTEKPSVWEHITKICNSPLVGLLLKCIIDFLKDS
ncbi:hypothetical protein SAMN05421780_111147 [Flexibacter flexilis DSM 6793]|uniref:Uncharacterized protein n=1 Tax=Flexibacter flexilis DSM 6793 TaxID=927664 RepID=A0A1I1N7H2_9BACT|nr:hypothetical protein [Flexibacter flexilis]SFC89680.1 hypothetical protein SAMN05421780_111147 [Flexibacter flexilis DSM 6793]